MATPSKKKTCLEFLQSLKQRNAEFWWFSKLLRETVECFGTEVEESSIAKFYHGTSMMVFSGTFFITNFNILIFDVVHFKHE